MENGDIMPIAYIEKISKDKNIPVKTLEGFWDEAKASAAKSDHAENYAYITGIFNNMIKKKKSISKEDVDISPIYASW